MFACLIVVPLEHIATAHVQLNQSHFGPLSYCHKKYAKQKFQSQSIKRLESKKKLKLINKLPIKQNFRQSKFIL